MKALSLNPNTNLGSQKLETFEHVVLDPFVCIDIERGDDSAERVGAFILSDFDVGARIPQNVPIFIQAVVRQA